MTTIQYPPTEFSTLFLKTYLPWTNPLPPPTTSDQYHSLHHATRIQASTRHRRIYTTTFQHQHGTTSQTSNIITCGFYIETYHKNPEHCPLTTKMAISTSISSICKYRLFTFITSINIYLYIRNLQYTISSQITTNIPAISGHFHVIHDTSDIHTCLHVNNISSLDSPCQNVYTKLKKKKSNFSWRPQL